MSTKLFQRPWKRLKPTEDNIQEETSVDENSCWSDCDNKSDSEGDPFSVVAVKTPEKEEEQEVGEVDSFMQHEEQQQQWLGMNSEETDTSETTDGSIEQVIQTLIEEHSNHLEDLRESLLDMGIWISLEELEQLKNEQTLAAFIRDSLYRTPTYRMKDEELKCIEDLSRKIEQSSHIMVISGAGISVSCGIPDFRSAGGIYDRIQEKFSLLDPQEIFDLDMFKENPEMFYSFAKEIIPKSTEPSLSHRFIKDLERHQKLLRNYAQNIDGLESAAGIDRVVYCHGSFSTAHCLRCGAAYTLEDIREDIVQGQVPRCSRCCEEESCCHPLPIHPDATPGWDEEQSSNSSTVVAPNVIKPDIVFFGEPLNSQFFDCFNSDREKVDLLLVIGTSLQVAPVSKIPLSISPQVPQVLVNMEVVGPSNHWFDLELIGPCDIIIQRLYQLLGWQQNEEEQQQRGTVQDYCWKEIQPRRFLVQPETHFTETEETS